MKHFFEEIQGWFCFQGPYRQAVSEASVGAVFVELGCWKGKSSCFLAVEVLNSGKQIEMHFVDHWGGSNEDAHKADPELQQVFDIFRGYISRVPDVDVMIHREDSAKAADLFEDNSVDFIWVDAGHEYDEALADIAAWWPKLKAGGVMGGDDYPMPGVNKAVKQFFRSHEVGSEAGWQWWRVRKGMNDGD